MSNQETQGTAWIDGQRVAGVYLSRPYEIRRTSVPLPGTGTVGVKEQVIWDQATIRFSDVADNAFRERLDVLIEFATAGMERKRAIRDQGARAVAVDLVMQDGDQHTGVSIEPPLLAGRQLESTAFLVHLRA